MAFLLDESESDTYLDVQVDDLSTGEIFAIINEYINYVREHKSIAFDPWISHRTSIVEENNTVVVKIHDDPFAIEPMDNPVKEVTMDFNNFIIDLVFEAGEDLSDKQYNQLYDSLEHRNIDAIFKNKGIRDYFGDDIDIYREGLKIATMEFDALFK